VFVYFLPSFIRMVVEALRKCENGMKLRKTYKVHAKLVQLMGPLW